MTKHFGDEVVLNDADLNVTEGEVFGFLGPNREGKSTTINLLLGFMCPTAGSASVLGLDTQADSDVDGLFLRDETVSPTSEINKGKPHPILQSAE